MTRRKRPPEGRTFAVSTFRDPASWQNSFLSYLDAECGMAKNTIDAYRRDLDRFFGWNRDHAKVGVHDIGVPTITSFLEFLQTLNLAASSIGRNLVAIRMFFRYLMLEGIVAESTVDLVSSPKLWERLPKVLSPDMVDALLVAPLGSEDRYYRRDRALSGCDVCHGVSSFRSRGNAVAGYSSGRKLLSLYRQRKQAAHRIAESGRF
jgi:integrase/recombinase XerD